MIGRASGQEKAHEGAIILSTERMENGILVHECWGLHLELGFDRQPDAIALPVNDVADDDEEAIQ